jgi:hypothetical protein
MPKVKPQSSINILFIGNSFTQRNDLPGLIEQLAAVAPDAKVIESQRIIANGASLRQHWNKGEAVKAIQQGTWDYVVLQEQTTLPIKNAQRFHENVCLFNDEIKKSGARTALYLTWARQNASETQDALNSATQAIANEIGAFVVPVGLAWHTALKENKALELYDKDGSHPSQAGSYLAACVFVAALLEQSPIGLSVPDAIRVDDKCAGSLQQVAWQTVCAVNTH